MIQPQEPALPNPFRLGEWEVRRDEGILCAGDQSVRLEPRVMDVLVHLAANPERVISKEELLTVVWGGAFVEEGALAQAIHSLRKALGDDARQPRFIQTVPKRGYRLVMAVVQESQLPMRGLAASPDASVAALQTANALPARRWPWLLLAILGLATVLTLALLGREHIGEAGSSPVPIRIVVLPFGDLGELPDPTFTAGLTQEITKDLGSIRSLQVIYRPLDSFGNAPGRHPDEIGRELGVDYVLEGVVKWQARPGERPKVRIQSRLIGVNGVPIWSGSFVSDVQDFLEVQTKISRQLIDALGLNLLPGRTILRGSSTRNLDAHRAYVRGRTLRNQPFYSEGQLLKAVLNFQRAVDLDPGFAAAWAELSMVHSYLAYNTDPTSERVNKARHALEQAMKFGRDLPEVKLAQAYYTYRCREDFDNALEQMDVAARIYPNDPEVHKLHGLILRRKGRFEEAIKAFRHAEWLNPTTGELVWILPETYRAMRNFEEADKGFAQAISQVRDEPFFWAQQALNRLVWKGDPEEARKILDESSLSGDPDIEMAGFRIDLYEGLYEQALARLSTDWVKELAPEAWARIAMMAAIARERAGDHRGAVAAAMENQAFLEANVARYPDRALFRACLAVALAQLGRRQEALDQAQKAVQMRQTDAFSGPRVVEIQAMVDTILGRDREAVDRLAYLRTISYREAITATDLRLNPVWGSLLDSPGADVLLQPSLK